MELEVIPRLAKGSWSSDMGVGCIMNLKCWEQQVDVRRPHITDQPEGFHPRRAARAHRAQRPHVHRDHPVRAAHGRLHHQR
jgi:hypothetical protein